MYVSMLHQIRRETNKSIVVGTLLVTFGLVTTLNVHDIPSIVEILDWVEIGTGPGGTT